MSYFIGNIVITEYDDDDNPIDEDSWAADGTTAHECATQMGTVVGFDVMKWAFSKDAEGGPDA